MPEAVPVYTCARERINSSAPPSQFGGRNGVVTSSSRNISNQTHKTRSIWFFILLPTALKTLRPPTTGITSLLIDRSMEGSPEHRAWRGRMWGTGAGRRVERRQEGFGCAPSWTVNTFITFPAAWRVPGHSYENTGRAKRYHLGLHL